MRKMFYFTPGGVFDGPVGLGLFSNNASHRPRCRRDFLQLLVVDGYEMLMVDQVHGVLYWPYVDDDNNTMSQLPLLNRI